MKRNFPDFLTAYQKYANDSVESIQKFNLWTGLSVISGALERNVWTKEGTQVYYPTSFILLVGLPGVGKSSAIRKGAKVIEAFRDTYYKEFKTLSGAATQAGFIKALSIFNVNMEGDQYSSLYYYAGEGADSGLNNLYGDFNSTLTLMYDCEDKYERSLKGEYVFIPKPSVCFLSGCTPEFLKTLINQNSVMNGLASRFIYCVSKDDGTRKGESRLGEDEEHKESEDVRLLAHDLSIINKLRGKFKVSKDAQVLYNQWSKINAEKQRETESERMKSLLVRKPVTLIKTAMLLSVSERNDLGITGQHMDQAIGLVEEVTADNASIISSAIMGNRLDQNAITQFIMQTAKKAGGKIPVTQLKSKFMTWGGDISKYDGTIKMLQEGEMITMETSGSRIELKLLVDPDRNL